MKDAGPASTSREHGARVLLVEDSLTQAAAIRAILEDVGHHVVHALDGVHALRETADARFDIVISDIEMPELDGYALCERLRRMEGTRDVPVLLLSAHSGREDVMRALDCGADSFLNKGGAPNVLITRVERLLEGRRIRAAGGPTNSIDVVFQDRRFTITAPRTQVVDMLLSTFEDMSAIASELRAHEQQLHDANAELARRLRLDPLTELPNRIALYEQMDELLQGRGEPWALLFIDLDRFKFVNDTFGHAAGDRILRAAGLRMAAALAEEDRVARLGGDEFAVVLPGADAQRAMAAARALLRALEAPFTFEDVPVTIGASIGVAVYPINGRDRRELLHAADLATYVAKSTPDHLRLSPDGPVVAR